MGKYFAKGARHRGRIMIDKPIFVKEPSLGAPFRTWVTRVNIWGEVWIWHSIHKPTKRGIRKFAKMSIKDFIDFHGDPIEYGDDENFALEG